MHFTNLEDLENFEEILREKAVELSNEKEFQVAYKKLLEIMENIKTLEGPIEPKLTGIRL